MWLRGGFPLIFVALFAESLGFTLQNVVDIVGMSKEVVVGLDKVWDIVESQIDRDMPHPMRNKGEERLFRKMNKLNMKLDELSAEVKSVGDNTLASLMRTIPERMRLELRLNDLQDYITRVHISYSRMQHYVRAAHKYEQLTMEDFSKKMISHDINSVVSLIERIHAFVAPQDEGFMNAGIMELLAKTFEESSRPFANHQSHFSDQPRTRNVKTNGNFFEHVVHHAIRPAVSRGKVERGRPTSSTRSPTAKTRKCK